MQPNLAGYASRYGLAGIGNRIGRRFAEANQKPGCTSVEPARQKSLAAMPTRGAVPGAALVQYSPGQAAWLTFSFWSMASPEGPTPMMRQPRSQ